MKTFLLASSLNLRFIDASFYRTSFCQQRFCRSSGHFCKIFWCLYGFFTSLQVFIWTVYFTDESFKIVTFWFEISKVLNQQDLLLIIVFSCILQVPQRYTGLANVYMHFSRSDNSGLGLSPALNVEQCSCPVGYTGLSCEGCSSGYRREVPYGNEYTNCVKCSCNNHSAICDPSTGICQNCQHRTTGE